MSINQTTADFVISWHTSGKKVYVHIVQDNTKSIISFDTHEAADDYVFDFIRLQSLMKKPKTGICTKFK